MSESNGSVEAQAPPKEGTIEKLWFTLLEPEQIQEHWDDKLKPVVEQVFPEKFQGDVNLMKTAYASMTTGAWQTYVIGTRVNGVDQNVVIGFALTTNSVDCVTGEKQVTLLSLYVYEGLGLKDWEGLFKQFKAVVRNMGCVKIVAETQNPVVARMANQLGGRTRGILFELEV